MEVLLGFLLVDACVVAWSASGITGGELVAILTVDEAAQAPSGRLLPQGRGVDSIVVAGVRLPDVTLLTKHVGARRYIEDRFESVCDHVVAIEHRTVADVEDVWLLRAEVPALARAPAEAVVAEERPHLFHGVGGLVVAEERRAGAAAIPAQRDDDQHRVAADMVVHVSPV